MARKLHSEYDVRKWLNRRNRLTEGCTTFNSKPSVKYFKRLYKSYRWAWKRSRLKIRQQN